MSLPLIIQFTLLFVVSFLLHFFLQTETALVAPVYKDNSTDPIQYIVQVYLETPLQPTKLALTWTPHFPWWTVPMTILPPVTSTSLMIPLSVVLLRLLAKPKAPIAATSLARHAATTFVLSILMVVVVVYPLMVVVVHM